MRKNRVGRRVLALVAAVGLAVAATACGSSTASNSGSSGASGTSASSSQASTAQSFVSSLKQRPTTLNVPALPSKPTPGKTVDYVACGLPVCVAFGTLIQSALQSVGWNYKFVNAGLTPQTVAAAYSQAVTDHPAGVIGSGGFSPTLFANQLKQLAAENVPVILSASAGAPNVTGVLAGPTYLAQDGTEMANVILADSHAKGAHVAIFTTPATPIYSSAHTAIENAMKNQCSGCSTTTYSFPETDIGTNLPTEVVSFLRTHPSVNYLFFDFSNEVDGVPSALSSAGLSSKVKIVTTDTTSTESQYLVQGQEFAAAAVPWPEFFWGGVNVILRASENAPLAPAVNMVYPHMILTGSNLPTTTGVIATVANYQSIYKTAWHVG